MFWVETDMEMIKEEKDFVLKDYKTILPKLVDTDHKMMIIGQIREEQTNRTKVRTDLTLNDFLSIWIEVEREHIENLVIGGFYSEWLQNNDSTKETQIISLNIITQQTEKATQKINQPE